MLACLPNPTDSTRVADAVGDNVTDVPALLLARVQELVLDLDDCTPEVMCIRALGCRVLCFWRGDRDGLLTWQLSCAGHVHELPDVYQNAQGVEGHCRQRYYGEIDSFLTRIRSSERFSLPCVNFCLMR